MENVFFKRGDRMVSAADILKEKLAETKKVAAPVIKVDTTELDALRIEFKAKLEKDVPVNKKNDVEWIKAKLAE